MVHTASAVLQESNARLDDDQWSSQIYISQNQHGDGSGGGSGSKNVSFSSPEGIYALRSALYLRLMRHAREPRGRGRNKRGDHLRTGENFGFVDISEDIARGAAANDDDSTNREDDPPSANVASSPADNRGRARSPSRMSASEHRVDRGNSNAPTWASASRFSAGPAKSPESASRLDPPASSRRENTESHGTSVALSTLLPERVSSSNTRMEPIPRNRTKACWLSIIQIMGGEEDQESADGNVDPPRWFFMINSDDGIFFKKHSRQSITCQEDILSYSKNPLKFTAVPCCHAFRSCGTAPPGIRRGYAEDAVFALGFHSGDVLVYDAVKRKVVVQFNDGNRVHKGAVTALCWAPASSRDAASGQVPTESQFLCAFGGISPAVYLFDITKNDEAFMASKMSQDEFAVRCNESDANPLLQIRVCPTQISQIAFANSGRLVAMSTLQGRTFLLDWALCLSLQKGQTVGSECVVAVCDSTFGSTHTVCWSADDTLLATAGEDDVVTVWVVTHLPCDDDTTISEKTLLPSARVSVGLVAMGHAHMNFVSRVMFDPFPPAVGKFRLVSVALDGSLALWDLHAALSEYRRARQEATVAESTQDSFDDLGFTFIGQEREDVSSTIRRRYPRAAYGALGAAGCIEPPSIDPVAFVRHAHREPIFDVGFTDDCIVTVCAASLVKFWARPNQDQDLF